MVLNRFRHIADRITKSQVTLLTRMGIKPNVLSVIGVIFGILASITLALPHFFLDAPILAWIPPFLFFISGYLDIIDGSVARASGNSSKFGAFLDSTLDRIGDAAVIVGLMIGKMFWLEIWNGGMDLNYLLGYISLSVTILISYTRSRAENEGVIMKGVGIMERGERFFALLFGIIIEAILRSVLPSYNHIFFPVFFCVYITLCVYTVIARIIHSYRWLTGKISTRYLKKHSISE